jgi:hypothetical protein
MSQIFQSSQVSDYNYLHFAGLGKTLQVIALIWTLIRQVGQLRIFPAKHSSLLYF